MSGLPDKPHSLPNVAEGKLRRSLAVVTAGTQTWLTIFVTTIYNVILAWGVIAGALPFKDYIFAVGPINAMVFAFWLGSETALRTPPARPGTETQAEAPKPCDKCAD